MEMPKMSYREIGHITTHMLVDFIVEYINIFYEISNDLCFSKNGQNMEGSAQFSTTMKSRLICLHDRSPQELIVRLLNSSQESPEDILLNVEALLKVLKNLYKVEFSMIVPSIEKVEVEIEQCYLRILDRDLEAQDLRNEIQKIQLETDRLKTLIVNYAPLVIDDSSRDLNPSFIEQANSCKPPSWQSSISNSMPTESPKGDSQEKSK
jgi:hypothetical protein